MHERPLSATVQHLLMVLVLCWLLPFAGCTSTSPRFHSSDPDPVRAEGVDDDAFLDTASLAAYAREDDRKVDVHHAADTLMHITDKRALDDSPSGLSRDRMLLGIVEYLGVRYQYGGNSKEGIDCSGFTVLMFANAASLKLPRLTSEQFRLGTSIPRTKLRFGDLVFFNTTGRRPSHVGIFLENDLFAHASIADGVTLSSLESTYYRKRYIGARRVVQ